MRPKLNCCHTLANYDALTRLGSHRYQSAHKMSTFSGLTRIDEVILHILGLLVLALWMGLRIVHIVALSYG